MPIENENSCIRENIKEQIKKIGVFTLSSLSNTIIQSFISIQVAKTKLTWHNFKTSCMYSAGIIFSEIFLEPKKFQWISNIKFWVLSKINPQQRLTITKTQLGISIGAFTLTSILLSYSNVILDILSNDNFETFFDLSTLQNTGTELSFSMLIALIESWIIEILIENLNLNRVLINENLDIETGNTNDETNLLDVNVSYINRKRLLLIPPLFLSSTGLIWLNESCTNGTDINSKILTDLPLLLMYNLGSIFFSLLNCIVNGDELPLIGLIKNYCIKSKTITRNIESVIDNSNKLLEKFNYDRLPNINSEIEFDKHIITAPSYDSLPNIKLELEFDKHIITAPSYGSLPNINLEIEPDIQYQSRQRSFTV